MTTDSSSTAVVAPPLPAIDVDSQGYWEAAAAGNLAICRCEHCREWLHPPLERCRYCAGPTRFEPVGGGGEIYSFIVVRHPSVPAFVPRIPYVVATVELDEHIRLPGVVVGVDPERVAIGQRVKAEWELIAGSTYPGLVWRADTAT